MRGAATHPSETDETHETRVPDPDRSEFSGVKVKSTLPTKENVSGMKGTIGPWSVAVLAAWCPACGALAAAPSLVPDAPSTAPDYFCTWNVQGFACSYSNASGQADMMTEASLFGKGPNHNWVEFYPEARRDLIFLLDDAFDFPLGGGHNHPSRGSLELDARRFPSYKGTPAERLAKLNRDVRAKGWRSLAAR